METRGNSRSIVETRIRSLKPEIVSGFDKKKFSSFEKILQSSGASEDVLAHIQPRFSSCHSKITQVLSMICRKSINSIDCNITHRFVPPPSEKNFLTFSRFTIEKIWFTSSSQNDYFIYRLSIFLVFDFSPLSGVFRAKSSFGFFESIRRQWMKNSPAQNWIKIQSRLAEFSGPFSSLTFYVKGIINVASSIFHVLPLAFSRCSQKSSRNCSVFAWNAIRLATARGEFANWNVETLTRACLRARQLEECKFFALLMPSHRIKELCLTKGLQVYFNFIQRGFWGFAKSSSGPKFIETVMRGSKLCAIRSPMKMKRKESSGDSTAKLSAS